MAKKRKSLASSLDEIDRTMYSTFCSAANSLSQLYSQAVNQQRLSFLAGERQGLEKLYQWISRQHGEGLRVTADDILAYIQTEMDSVEEPSVPPRTVQQNPQQTQVANLFTNSGSSSVPAAAADPAAKNYIFSNALSSPVRRSLQNYHISQEGLGGAAKSHEHQHQHQGRDSNPFGSFDSSMDIHADSTGHDSTH